MYIPCQIVDTSSLESQSDDGSSIHLQGCCPCLPSQKHEREVGSFEAEDPELLFSRHRAAVIAGHRFFKNHGGGWNVQSEAPPLPQTGPPPLPPRKMGSFFPQDILPRRKGIDEESTVPVQVISSSVPAITKRARKPIVPFIPEVAPQKPAKNSGINCPYLSPIDVAATSWEWDFGNNETLSSEEAPAPSISENESGATDRVNIWGDPPVVKKGLLMQQREKIWSRWKERYFILTRDYLHCFRRLRNVYRLHITLSAMGQFIYKLRLANVEDIQWDVRRGGSRISLQIRHEPTILLKSSNNDDNDLLYHWYSLLQECICMSKIRRQAIRVFNTSSEEDSNSSNQSRFSAAIITNEDCNISSHSSFGNSSRTSRGSSSQTDLVDLYRRCGTRQSIHSSASNIPVSVRRPPPNPRRQSGFYLHDPRPPSQMSRPATHLFKRAPLPVLDSETECDDHELHGILEGLPKRCQNPTREIEASSHASSHRSSVPRRVVRSPSLNNEEIDELDDLVTPFRCESRLTLREFVKTPWRPSSCLPDDNLRETSSSRLSAFPIPARRPLVPQRPSSSFSRPPPGVFGGRKVLPTPWTKNPTLQIGKGVAFSRSNVIVCPSKLSADVTYLRRV